MNPDSINLILKSLFKMKFLSHKYEMTVKMFNAIIDLLEKDNNINFFNEI